MLHALRRCRVLALALLLAAPGLGGTWLALAHPCAVDMPWLAAGDPPDPDAQTSHGHGDAHDTSSGSCSCVGACQSGTASLIDSPARAVLTAVTTGWTSAPTAPDTDPPAEPSPHRHPPATAPPLA
jgi:hypothetical protein